jgi:hypothetical protein
LVIIKVKEIKSKFYRCYLFTSMLMHIGMLIWSVDENLWRLSISKDKELFPVETGMCVKIPFGDPKTMNIYSYILCVLYLFIFSQNKCIHFFTYRIFIIVTNSLTSLMSFLLLWKSARMRLKKDYSPKRWMIYGWNILDNKE